MIADNDLCFFCLLRSASDWNLPLPGFDFRRNQFLFLCSFQGALSTALRLTEWRVEREEWRSNLPSLRFSPLPSFLLEVSCEPSKRYRQEIQSDASVPLSLSLSYINRSYSASFDSLAVLRTDFSIPIDLRIRTAFSAVHLSLERR